MSMSSLTLSQAIEWAKSMKVQIISMSWTINETPRNKEAIGLLKGAIYDAEKAGILLFCSVSDQGVKKNMAYPASLSNVVFRIGAATAYGDTWKWVGTDEADVDFILPGTRLRVDTRDPVVKNVKPCSGSSLATALAAGLAAVVLDCVAINDPAELNLLRSRANMKMAFESKTECRPPRQRPPEGQRSVTTCGRFLWVLTLGVIV